MKTIKLKKGMTRLEVNSKLISSSVEIVFEDEIFNGVDSKHTWKCECGELIVGRMWSTIRNVGSIKCDKCKWAEKEEEYKQKILTRQEYSYIRSFRKGEEYSEGKVVKRSPKVKLLHKYCGSSIILDFDSFINRGDGCTKCCGSYENSFAYHIEQELGLDINDVWDFEKNIANPYHISKNAHSKVFIKCKYCNESYNLSCYHYVNGRRCPSCKKSIGEKRVEDFLVKNNIEYTREKVFKGLTGVGGSNLRYDFYIKEINTLIEYDGELHYMETSIGNNLKKQQIHDKIKDKFARDNNMKLIRIPYWEKENIEKILSDSLGDELC